MAGSSTSILVRILGNNSSLTRALSEAYLSLGGLERITATITSGFKVAAIAAGVFSASAVAAGFAGAAALAGIPVILLAVGIAAAAQSKKVRDAYSDMADHVVKVMKRIAAPLVDPLVRGAGTIRRAFDLIAPALARIFQDAAPLLDRLFAQLIPLARQLGPLLEQAFGAGAPVLEAFVRGLNPVVAGLAGMFAILGASSGDFQAFVQTLMSGLGELLPALATLLAALAPIGTSIAASLLPALASLLELLAVQVAPAVQLVTGFFTEHETIVRTLVAALAGLLVLSQIASLFIALGSAIGVLLSPAILVVAAIAAIAAGLVYLYGHSEQARTAMQAIAGVFMGTVVPAAKALGEYVRGTLAPAIADTARKVGANLQPVAEQIADTFMNDVVPAVKAAYERFREAWPEIQKLAERIGNAYKAGLDFWSALQGKILPVLIDLAGKILGVVVPAIAQHIVMMVKIANAIIDAAQAAGRFASAVKDKFTEAVNFVRSIPGKIIAALGGMGDLLTSAGSALIGGFVSGITSRIGDVESTLRGLTGKLTSWKGPPEKDATLLQRAGQLIMEGFIRGIRDGIPGVKDVLGEVSDLVTKVMDKRFKNDKKAAEAVRRVLAGLRDERLALLANADAHDRVMDKLDAARDKLRALKDAAKGYAEAAKSAAIGFANITTSGVGAVTQNANTILAGLGQRLKVISEFRAGLAQLREMGLNQTSLDQILQAGVEGGIDTVRALLDGTQGTLDAINNIQGQINDAASGLGTEAADSMYGAGISAAQGLVDRLKEKAAEIAQIGVTLADAFLDALRAAGINVGPGGAGLGIVPPTAGNAIAFQPLAAAQTTNVNLTVNVPVGASPVDAGREIQRALEAFFAAGGRALVTS